MMNFNVITLFPEMIHNTLNHSIIKRASDKNLININTIDIRDFSDNKHNHIDDYPYGGGAGMLMQAEPIYKAYKSIPEKVRRNTRVVYMSPQGKIFNQKIAEELSKEENIIILCGHYEGIDERVLDEIVTDEISIGDYVLTGGEIAACVIIDSVSRLITGVLNKNESYENETFSDGLCEYPQYTRPDNFLNKKVPDVLLSGNHQDIEKWRREQSLKRTLIKRPDLLETAVLSQAERNYIKEYKLRKTKAVVNKLISEHTYSNSDLSYIIENKSNEITELFMEHSNKSSVDFKTIVFSNKYRDNCLLNRYDKNDRSIYKFRMSEEEIFNSAKKYIDDDNTNIILKCGNDPLYTDEIITSIIAKVKKLSPSILIADFGIKSPESLELYKNAGIDGFVYNICTTSEKCFRNIYTKETSYNEYIKFYDTLKNTNLPIYCLFTLQLPYETTEDIVNDIAFIKKNKPDYAIFNPFIPVPHTEFSDYPAGDTDFAVFINSIINAI